MAELEVPNQNFRRRASERISRLLRRRASTRRIVIKEDVDIIEPPKIENKHWTERAWTVSVLAQEAVLFAGILTLAYFLRFRKDIFNTFYFPLESCTDMKYGYPYLTDTDAKDYTNIRINHKAFYCVTFLVTLFLLTAGEFIFYYINYIKPTDSSFRSCLTPTLFKRWFKISSIFIIGIFINSIATDVIKLLASRPRPHFLTVCEPNLDICTKQTFSSDICNGDDTDAILEARFSFPSFYASHTMFIAVYMATYVHWMFKPKQQIYTVKPLLVGTSVLLGFLGGFPRYQLNYNHGTDLFIGYIVGSLVALYFVIFVLHKFQEKPPKKTIVYKRIVPDMRQASEKEFNETNDDALEENRPYTNLPPVAINKKGQSTMEVQVQQEEAGPSMSPPPEEPTPPTPPPRMTTFVMPPPPPLPPKQRSISSSESSESETTTDSSDSEESSDEEMTSGVVESPCIVVSDVLDSLRASALSIPFERDRAVSEAYDSHSENDDEIHV